MKRRLIFTIIALFLILPLNGCSKTNQHEHPKGHDQHLGTPTDLELSGQLQNGIRVIELKASRYKFEPDPIVVNLGEKVKLVVVSTDVAHGIAIPEFNVNLTIPAGKASTVEFVADKKGTFHAHCSVYCGPGHSHMHGTLIVE